MPHLSGDPLRILYIGWANHVHFQRWVAYFTGAGHQAWVLPITPTRPGLINGARVLRYLTRGRRPALQRLELRLLQALHRFDVVHVQWAGFAAIPFDAGLAPYAVTAWGSDIYGLNDQELEARRRVVQGLHAAALVTVDSEDLRRAVMMLGVPPERVKVVQWGVDTALFRPDVPTSPARARFGVGEGPVIYSPRNIAPVYNNDTILEAFRKVLDRHPDAIMIEKHYKRLPQTLEAYRRKAEELGVAERLVMVGDIPYEEIPPLYAMSTMSVSVPSSDATPVSILEAMACGSIPVSSDLPSIREWISHGENGFLVPVRDVDALAECMLRVLQGGPELEAMRTRNRQLVMDRAEHSRNMQEMEGYYRGLAGR
jgi:glycosyltransferase involved in cell wall biosynthesis